MRFHILDDVVDPLTGAEMCVENADVLPRGGAPVGKCNQWCGYRGRSPADVALDECRECQNLWIVSGDLVAAGSRYPIVNGIPRLLPDALVENVRDAALSRATQESFGYEWEHFDHILPEYEAAAHGYFHLVPEPAMDGAVVLDAGCGMGRWARYVAKKPIRRLYALDYSRAIDRAAVILEKQENAHCLQADIRRLPFRPKTFDLIYSLGVLHHLANPDEGMYRLVQALKDSGCLLVYLYYALDNRPFFYHWLFRIVTAVRWFTSCLPKPLMHGLAWPIALGIYWPLARLTGILERVGFRQAAQNVPLHHYQRYSLGLMVADAFDRFATPVEKRYTRAEIEGWLARYGLRATFSNSSPYWVVLASKPG
jgi:SAM-dependent methyltransferase